MSKNGTVVKVMLGAMHKNEKNPRKISEENFRHLIRSILEFPKMLELRPIVISKDRTILGGNMRFEALCAIMRMDSAEMQKEIMSIESVKKKTEEEQEQLIEFWVQWRGNPFAYIEEIDVMDSEQMEFVIKDNVHYGQWDYDMLRGFSEDDLAEACITPWDNTFKLGDDDSVDSVNETSKEEVLKRIIIAFPRGRRAEVEKILGINKPGRTSYSINELNCIGNEDRI